MTNPSSRPDPDADPDETVVRSRPLRAAGWANVGPGRRALVIGGGVVLVLGVLYLVGYLAAGDRLPRDASIAGVDVGGQHPDAAVATLTAELGPRVVRPISVTLGDARSEVDPVAAGLGVDYPASVAAAGGGRSLDPAHIIGVLTGGGATDAVLTVDEVKLSAAVQSLASTYDHEPANARLAYAGTKVKQTTARTGVVVDVARTATALRSGVLAGGAVPIPAAVTEPEVTDAEASAVATDFAGPAVSDRVRVSAGAAGSFFVTPAMIARSISFPVEQGTLKPQLDAGTLHAQAADVVKTVELTKPRDATVRLVRGKPKVIPAVDGTTVTAAGLKAAVEPALTESGAGRRVTLRLSGARAAFSTADARKLGIRKVTGEFTTHFPYLEYRNVNIGRAAELINGTIVKPGDTFSLNKTVGERTRANGFTEGFIIKGGKFKKELGGGVSQSATTTYNAMFFAGLKDVQHQPHTLYIDRYPPGREATVAWPSLDLKFQNDTAYGVLVQAFLVKAAPGRPGSLTVRMWSTKTWDKVVSTTPVKSNFTTGRDLDDDSASCEPMVPVAGFDVDYQRLFYRDGSVAKREKFHWRYAPTDKVTCTR